MIGALGFLAVIIIVWACAVRRLRQNADALISARDALKALSDGLETTVAERTAALRIAEADLRMQNELMHDMSEIARVGGWAIDLRDRAISWTPQTYTMFDAESDFELSLEASLKLYDEASLPEITNAYLAAIQTGAPFDIEAKVKSAKGRDFWVRLIGRVSHLDGEPRYLVGAVQDITTERERRLALENQTIALKDAQTELQIQNAHLKQMSELANVGGWEIDLKTGVITWSEQTKRIHEVPLDFVPLRSESERFCSAETAARTLAAFKSMLENDTAFELEIPITTARGNARMLRSIGRVIREHGVPVRAIGALQDITSAHERRLELEARTAALQAAQNTLHRQYELMEDMAELANVGAWETDLAVGMSEWNAQTRRIHDVDDDFVPTREAIHAFYSEETRANMLAVFAAAKGDGASVMLDYPMTTAKGRPVRVRVVCRKIERLGEPVRFVGAIQDITKEYAIQREMAEAREAAEAANKAKSAFLANMSHEIRTPLNGVIGLAGALAQSNLDARQSEMVSLIRNSGETLERLLGDILDMSKIEAGKLSLQVDSFDLREAVETAAQVMRVRADDKGVDFTVTYGESARGIFEGDVVRLRQIISNLTSNAVKFTNKGAVALSVEVEDRNDAPALLRIVVRDTGIGFDEETAKRLFNRFEQADGAITKSFGGTGLGLSISKALCDLMGGDIHARAAPGQGAVFTVEIPLDRTIPLADFDAREQPTANATSEAMFNAEEDAAPLRILLAEDHPTNQRVVALILEPFGVDLTIANNGREALEAFSVQHFDLVLMDMQMPEMDGLTATRAIRTLERERANARTPIAMLSANAMQDHIDQAMAAGCDSHIAKPVTPETLIAGVEFLLAASAEAAQGAEVQAA
jgi:signal transduction histidine kinase/AmiR/NasT family two-component response regulator